ncbi:pyridoxal kinase PdxY [Comamonas kerstersii]|uniref:pyridoxal kinase PdxY n=1 Tax=Comamonas kerstersii TaxID=225992 RepID=UPI00098427E8|nr:pyridoxal kinase PdxY [Comamonas kerstersii]OOH84554.1 pyridoxal kinase [Comamonas kerstersii]OOH91398.1 pyridoxal kinase [Comamonas kerstersii]
MNILSIQSHVSYGHVGNSAAVFPLQRLGHEVWPVYTVNFSNHTGYGQWGGSPIPASEVTAIISAMEQRGALAQVDVVLSGYQGGTDIADAILDAVARVKAANPNATYTCDPVMGNAKSGCFVNPAIPELLRERVVPKADLVTPNQFELGYLAGMQVQTLEETLKALDAVMAMGPRAVLVTSVFRPDAAPGTIEMLAADANGAWLVTTPHLPFKANGSGDVTAALFTAHYSQHFGAMGSAKLALERTKASMFELLTRTHESGQRELQLVQAQESYVNPKVQFAAQQVR